MIIHNVIHIDLVCRNNEYKDFKYILLGFRFVKRLAFYNIFKINLLHFFGNHIYLYRSTKKGSLK